MNKHSIYLKAVSLVLCMGLVVGESLVAGASIKPGASNQVQQTPSANILAGRRSRLRGIRVRNIGSSRQRRGGISCGGNISCGGEKATITPLVPHIKPVEVYGQEPVEVYRQEKEIWNPVETSTIKSRPTLLVYVSGTTKTTAMFYLNKVITDNQEDEILDNVPITLPGHDGIVSISLPENVQLDLNQTYHWIVTIECDPNSSDQSGNVFAEGWVKRTPIPETLANQLKNAQEFDIPQMYADAGLWTDTLSSVWELRQRYPNDPDVETAWQILLEQVAVPEVSEMKQATLN
ncbi:MAG TPA: hypothetical protein DDZ80_12265 [Cyanobacteria bacterium UBA8803]|nr:hypothetical protein [Cyanobacteria bacterium UBA9273]HBL59254.1 hypothetical protein [Cyanobacteria bacterium UBA8803]